MLPTVDRVPSRPPALGEASRRLGRRSAEESEAAGLLGIGCGFALFVGPHITTPTHRHRAVQVVLSAQAPFEIQADHRSRISDVALLPSGAPHAIRTSSSLAILLVESDGPRGRRLDALARGPLSQGKVRALRAVQLPTPTSSDLVRAAQGWIDALEGGPRRDVRVSDEVTRVLSVVDGAAQRGEPMGLVDVARAVSLSPTRVTHRVSFELGLPYRAVVRWTRMRFAMRARYSGKSLTEAALSAGFADASHLSRTFRATLGISPSWLVERVGFLDLEIDRAVQAPRTGFP